MSERVRSGVNTECTKAGECTHPYKRKIEASVERGVVWMVLGPERRRGAIYIKQGRKD